VTDLPSTDLWSENRRRSKRTKARVPVVVRFQDSNKRFVSETTRANHPPLGGQLHASAAQPPPANIPMKMRETSTTVPDSHSVGSSLPPGTPAVQRPATAAGAAEILIENARLEFRLSDRKQRLAIESNRERMALSFSRNHGKTAGPAKSGGTQTARRMLFVSQGKQVLQGNDVLLRAQDRGRGVVLGGRKRKASLTNFEPPECE
jgi:hypothetical protein